VAGPPAAVEESASRTVKVEVPETVGTPLMTPVFVSDKPVGRAPLDTVQLSAPAPPVA